MNPIDYIDSLIAGMEMSSIPIQKSELVALKAFIIADQRDRELNNSKAAHDLHRHR